jgi:uncharacterized protein YbjT (DUF2867 family)
MKITLTGAAGNITKPLAEKLLSQGHTVTVIGRNKENLKPLTDKGAETAIGSIEDGAFITNAFQGADVVYTMIPAPYHIATDWVEYSKLIGENYRKGIEANNINKVVNLSTYGAHLTSGRGILQSITQLERELSKLQNVEVINLRGAYFYSNLVPQIASIKSMGVIGSNYGNPENVVPLVHTKDIADVAFEAITTSNISSKEPYYVVSDKRSLNDIASVLGKAIGKELSWTPFTDEQLKAGLEQSQFPPHLIGLLIELGQQLAKSESTGHYFSLVNKPSLGKVKLEDFAKEFAKVYKSN